VGGAGPRPRVVAGGIALTMMARDEAPEMARDEAPEMARDEAPEMARDEAPEMARDEWMVRDEARGMAGGCRFRVAAVERVRVLRGDVMAWSMLSGGG